jgi:hypothetical protein
MVLSSFVYVSMYITSLSCHAFLHNVYRLWKKRCSYLLLIPISGVSSNFLGLVQLLQILLLLLGQNLAARRNRLVDTGYAGEADNGTGHALVDPGERHMTHGPAALLGELLDAPDYGQVGLDGAVRARRGLLLEPAPVRAAKVARRPGQVAAAERGPGDQADARVVAEAVHLALLFSV